MKTIACIAAFSLSLILFHSCYYDVEEELYPSNNCDTTGLVYDDILPIFKSNCYVCHGNGENQGGIELGSYDKLKTWVDNGILLCAIEHRKENCSNMPKNSPKLDSCSIAKIRNWINEGSAQ